MVVWGNIYIYISYHITIYIYLVLVSSVLETVTQSWTILVYLGMWRIRRQKICRFSWIIPCHPGSTFWMLTTVPKGHNCNEENDGFWLQSSTQSRGLRYWTGLETIRCSLMQVLGSQPVPDVDPGLPLWREIPELNGWVNWTSSIKNGGLSGKNICKWRCYSWAH